MSDDTREADQLDGVRLPEHAPAVIGHAPAQRSIAARLEAGRLPGAILLHGPRGIGKATLAFAATRQILAATGDESAEHVAAQVMSGSHPNLFILRRQPRDTGRGFYTVIRVDEIRTLRERMRQTRGRAGHRVAIIDAIDDCNPNAANALLKLLEEPPAETTFLLVSHRPGSLLPTIRSRCHAVAMRPLSDVMVRAVLEEQRPDADLDRAVDLAEGRPRRGFEALALSEDSALGALRAWLADPTRHPPAVHLALGDSLAGNRDSAEFAFAQDLIRGWIAGEATTAATAGGARLASANQLWEKAGAAFADAEEFNLDARQTLIGVLDQIRRHALRSAPAEI
jgi:DNA polymerase-3 subunit delta'